MPSYRYLMEACFSRNADLKPLVDIDVWHKPNSKKKKGKEAESGDQVAYVRLSLGKLFRKQGSERREWPLVLCFGLYYFYFY
jgi:hypothetical protein